MYRLENTAVFIMAVAPFTGARVETSLGNDLCQAGQSLPSRERELKLQGSLSTHLIFYVAPFTGARVETKVVVSVARYALACRSLHGSAS